MEIFSEADKIEIEIYNILKTVIDPELGVNIVDLGLIYKIGYNNETGIKIEMTLSTKGCPMGDVIMDNAKSVVEKKFPNKKLDLILVWEPAWSPDLVTPDGKTVLGLMR